MANFYAQISETLIDHPKTTRLMRSLRVHRLQTVGHLACLWCWTMKNAPDGNLSRFSYRDISDAARWTSKDDFDEASDERADVFVKAMIACRTYDEGVGFLENDRNELHIHDWAEYGGRLEVQRERNAFLTWLRRHSARLGVDVADAPENEARWREKLQPVECDTPCTPMSSRHSNDIAPTSPQRLDTVATMSPPNKQRVEQSSGEQSPRGEPNAEPVTQASPAASAISASMPNGNSTSALPVSAMPTALLVPKTLVERLMDAGLDKPGATKFAKECPQECERQLTFWPYRDSDVRTGGYLHKAIKGRYNAPEAYASAHPPPGAPKAETAVNASSEVHTEREKAADNRVVTAPSMPKFDVPKDWLPDLEEETTRAFCRRALQNIKAVQADIHPISEAVRNEARRLWRLENPHALIMEWEEEERRKRSDVLVSPDFAAKMASVGHSTPAVKPTKATPAVEVIPDASEEAKQAHRAKLAQLKAECDENDIVTDCDYSAPNNLQHSVETVP